MRIPEAILFPATGECDNSPLESFLRRKRNHLEHNALVEAQNSYAAIMETWAETAMAERPGAAAAGLVGDSVARHIRAVDEVLGENSMGAAAREGFRVWAKERGAHLCLRLAVFEDAQRQQHAQEQHDIRRGGIFRAAMREPEGYQDHLGQLEEIHALSVGQGLFPAEEAQKRLNRDRYVLKNTVFDALYAKDPGRALDAMPELGFDEARRVQEQRRLAADARAGELLADAARRDRVRVLADASARAMEAASLTGEGEPLREIAAQYLEVGEQARAAEHRRLADFFEGHAVVIRESMVMDLPALAAMIRSMEKALYGAETVPLRDKVQTERGLRLAVYEHRKRAFAEDPAKAVADEAQGESEEETMVYRLAAQERHGVQEGERRVLTQEETRLLARVADQLAGAGEAACLEAFREFQARLGRYWPRALEEVVGGVARAPAKGESAPENSIQGDCHDDDRKRCQ